MAHERQLIQKGCVIKLVASHVPDLTKSSEDTEKEKNIPTITLQLLKKGKKEEYVDINLKNQDNPFDIGFKWAKPFDLRVYLMMVIPETRRFWYLRLY